VQSRIGVKTELYRRIAFTLGALAIYRLGRYIPVPGINPQILAEILQPQPSGFLGAIDASVARALARLSIFALGIGPYLSASFVILILTSLSVRLRKLVSGERLMRVTLLLTIVFAALNAYGLARGLEASGRGGTFGSPVMEPGALFHVTTVVTLTTGTAFLVWLAEQITKRGIGNGISLMLFSAIVVRMPETFYRLFEDDWAAFLPAGTARTVLIAFVGLVVFIVLIESAQLRIPVRYPHRPEGSASFDATSWLRFKLNNAGIVPIYFVGQLLLLPATISNASEHQDNVIAHIAVTLSPGTVWHMAAGAVLIVILSLVYVALVLSPKRMAQDLTRYGGVIPALAPGEPTADYLDRLLTWATLIGALYLWAVSMLASYFAELYRVPLTVSAVNLLVVAAAALDTIRQIRALWSTGLPAKSVADGVMAGASGG